MTDRSADPVLVIGAGIMGIGIAQVAAQAGHPVMPFDARDGAAAEGRCKRARSFDGRLAKGKISDWPSPAMSQSAARPVRNKHWRCGPDNGVTRRH